MEMFMIFVVDWIAMLELPFLLAAAAVFYLLMMSAMNGNRNETVNVYTFLLVSQCWEKKTDSHTHTHAMLCLQR